MKKLHSTTQYKKDYKRFRNNPNKLKKLMTVLNMLQSEIKIPPEYYPHMLSGGYMESKVDDIWNAILKATFCLFGLTLTPTK